MTHHVIPCHQCLGRRTIIYRQPEHDPEHPTPLDAVDFIDRPCPTCAGTGLVNISVEHHLIPKFEVEET